MQTAHGPKVSKEGTNSISSLICTVGSVAVISCDNSLFNLYHIKHIKSVRLLMSLGQTFFPSMPSARIDSRPKWCLQPSFAWKKKWRLSLRTQRSADHRCSSRGAAHFKLPRVQQKLWARPVTGITRSYFWWVVPSPRHMCTVNHNCEYPTFRNKCV